MVLYAPLMLDSLKSMPQSLKRFAAKNPKGFLGIAGIGLCGVAAVVILAANATQNVSAKSDTQAVHNPQTAVASVKSGLQNTGTSHKSSAANPAGAPASTSSNPKTGVTGNQQGKTSANQAASVKADYNLNDTLYFDQAYGGGTFNLCWQTHRFDNTLAWDAPANAYVAMNDEACGASGSLINIYQTAIASTPSSAVDLASSKVQLAANAQNVVLRKGAGGEAVLLTEAICSANGLSCGRW